MIRGRELIGMPVFSLDQGEEIGEVKNLIFDAAQKKIIGLILDEGGLFRDPKVVGYEEVKTVGPGSIVLKRELERAAPSLEVDKDLLKKSFNLTGKRAISEEGHDLGTIYDLYIDENSGRVFGLELTQGVFRDTSEGRKSVDLGYVRTIGEDTIVVDATAIGDLLAQKGGISKTFASMKEAGSESLEKAKERAKETYQTVKASSVESLEKAREKSEALSLRAREKGEALSGRFLEKKESWGASTHGTLDDLRAKSRERMIHGRNKASRFWSRFEEELEETYENTKRYFSRLRERYENYRIEQALGRRVSRTILDPADNVILQQGDIITHKAVLQAREARILDSVLNSVVKENLFLLRQKESQSAAEEMFTKRPPLPGQKERLQKTG